MAESGTRRGFLVGAAASLAAPPAALAADGADGSADEADALTLLLTVERVSASFYRRAPGEVALGAESRGLAAELGRHEVEHRRWLLRVARREGLEVDERLRHRVTATDEAGFLRRAAALERTSVGAYGGAIAHVRSRPLTEALAGIAAVEGRHAAAVLQAAGRPYTEALAVAPLSATEVLDRLASFSTPEAEPAP